MTATETETVLPPDWEPLEPLEHDPGTDNDDQEAGKILPDKKPARASVRAQLTPTEKLKVRKAIINYCLRSEHSNPRIHYSQSRPYHHLGIAPEHGFTADCSSFVTGALFWGGDATDIHVIDPNDRSYDGFGYTGTLLHANITHPVRDGRKYLAGDIVLYGPAYRTKHTAICRAAGMANTAIWTSHGSEAGPMPVRLHYRSDVLIVVRPRSLL